MHGEWVSCTTASILCNAQCVTNNSDLQPGVDNKKMAKA